MWTRFSLTRWLLLLALLCFTCSGCSAADWTITRTHHQRQPRVSLFGPRVVVVPQAMPQVVPQARPAAVAVERDSIPAIPPLPLTAPLAPAVPLTAIPVTPASPTKKIQIHIEK